MGEVINNGSMIVAILVIFVAGFIFKVIYTLCYNAVMDKIECKNFRQSEIINDIIGRFEKDNKDRGQIKNTSAYVKSELNKWKKCGIYVERMNDYGDAAIRLCIIIGAIVDMYLISNYNSGKLSVEEVIIRVSVYSFIPIICLMTGKLWDYATGIEYKKKTIFDEIVNYIDNRTIYIRFNVSANMEEKRVKSDGKISNDVEEYSKKGIINLDNETDNISANEEKEQYNKSEVIEQVLNEYL